MKKTWLFFSIVSIACIGGSVWFWRLGSVPLGDGEMVTVQRNEQQKEFIQQGDTIQTKDESVIISFYGLAETRLAPHSRIKIDTASRPLSFGSGIHVDLYLEQGHAWNSVQKIFDSDAGFRVRTDAMTVHVRGTSFDVQTSATGSSIAVLHSAVEIQGAKLQPTILTEGSMMTFAPDGSVLSTNSIDDALYQSEWFKENTHQDQRFDTELSTRVTRFVESLGERPLEGIPASIVALSESSHTMLSSRVDASRLYALYVLRRIAIMKQLAHNGKAGLADEAWNAMTRDMTAITESKRSDFMSALRHGLQEGMFLFADTMPTASEYPLKLDVENAYIELHTQDTFAYQYARLVGIHARLDEADTLISQSALQEVQSGLDAARDGIANVEREINKKDAPISQDQMRLIRSTLDIVKTREAALRLRLNVALSP